MTNEENKSLNERHPKLGGIYPACDSGWFNLVDVLCYELQRQTDKHGAPQLEVIQIKEKLGGLRFQVQAIAPKDHDTTEEPRPSPTQRALISMAERLSYLTCEKCGRPGSTQEDREWIQTLCAEHAVE
ncbi:hypothetical protein P245_27935 [Comamonas thiooxydans]|uniref:Uncharacterized protein n=1 Tax=Comamonas thiooxydans TaxID=363952 RepID=A0A0E3BU18_9BURK|nr:hypothetical protein [Comamonas thiooxydans]KGG81909.1 hypothetical protein P245_27935 [Comamonas thiooxydans]